MKEMLKKIQEPLISPALLFVMLLVAEAAKYGYGIEALIVFAVLTLILP